MGFGALHGVTFSAAWTSTARNESAVFPAHLRGFWKRRSVLVVKRCLLHPFSNAPAFQSVHDRFYSEFDTELE
jgi:hypothetical protein